MTSKREDASTASASGVPHYVLGTAGHIDHGKSSLIRALTGIDPDRLEEEKRRGITIELGFARLDLPDGSTMGVVDVPGHERFVRQMIAGATGIDLALLCIAADDGIMPQTLEHLAVLELLGVPKLVVALTKTDLVDDEWVSFMTGEVNTRLADTPYAASAVVPVSARTGSGLDDLRAALVAAAQGLKRAKAGTTVRMPVDRAFSIKGSGTVVTGTLWSGRVQAGDRLDVLPAGVSARVRGVQEHGAAVDVAEAGNRVAINLGSVGLDRVRPGMFVAAPGTVTATDRFDAQVSFIGSGRQERGELLKTGAGVRVAHGTAEVTGRVLFLDGVESLSPHDAAYAQIRLDEPLPVSRGDRFVLRSMSPVRVIAGGRVLQAHPRRRTNLREGERELLDALYAGDDTAAIDAAFARQTAPVCAADVAASADADPDAALHRLDELVEAGDAVRIGRDGSVCFASPAVLQKHLAACRNTLLRFHTEEPDAPGMTKAALRDRLPGRMSEHAFDGLVAYAQAEGLVTIAEGGFIGHPEGAVNVQAREQRAVEILAEALAQAGAAPPAPEALCEGADIDVALGRRALAALEKQGRARRIAIDLVFDEQAYTALVDAAVACLRENGSATAAELKDAMGLSRKYAIPLLEYLDGKGITRRDGDVRVLGPTAG